MNKLIKLALSILMLLACVTVSPLAEASAPGSSMDNPINACVIENGSEISCNDNTYSSMLRDMSQNINLHFVDTQSGEQYSFTNLERGLAIVMDGQKILVQSQNLHGERVMPQGTYNAYIEITKYNASLGAQESIWLKPGTRNENAPQFGPLLQEVPSNAKIESNDAGGIKIRCDRSGDMNACNVYLNAVLASNNGYSQINEYNSNNFYLGSRLSAAYPNGSNIFKHIPNTPSIEADASHFYNNGTFENKDTNVLVDHINGYTPLIGHVNPLTISAPLGSEDNPITGCTLVKDTSSSEKNAFIATCPNGDVIFTNDGYNFDNRALYLIEKDDDGNKTGKEYSGFNLFNAKINVNTKQLMFDNTILEISNINVNGIDTHLPKGKYDVLFEKMNSMGQMGSGTFYLLGTDVEFDQIKKPHPESATIANDVDNSIVIACDVTEDGCSEWIDAVYDNIPKMMSRAAGGEMMYQSSINFNDNYGDGVYFNGLWGIDHHLVKVKDQNNQSIAIKIPGDKLATIGFKNINYFVSIEAYLYVRKTFDDFQPNVVIKDPTSLLSKIEIIQDDEYPYEITIKCKDQETYDYVKNAKFDVYDSTSENQPDGWIGWFGEQDGIFDENNLSRKFSCLTSTKFERQNVNIQISSNGYEDAVINDVDMRFKYTIEINDEKIVISSNGIQIYSENEDFLKFLIGEIESKYNDQYAFRGVSIYERNTFGEAVDWQEIVDENLFGDTIHTNATTGKKYVLINTPRLAELNFDVNKIYDFNFHFEYDYSWGNLYTDRYTGLSNDYFKGLSEDNSYSDMTDDENLKILGVVLGMDATDNNPNSIKLIYKEVQKNGNTEDLGVDMPKVVGAIIERENEKGGFSKDNLDYLDANKVELGITFDNLDEADLEEGFKQFDVTKTDVGFEVTLTNKYFNGSEEVREDNIEELPAEATITFDLPDDELEDGKEYMLLTVHKGKPKLIKIKVEKDPVTGKNRGTALVSQFSPFMVVEVAKNTGGNTGSTIPGGTSSKPVYIVNTSTK